MNLDFLTNVKVVAVDKPVTKGRTTLEKTPVDGADFRLYKNGRLFPHPTAVENYGLEFSAKVQTVDVDGKVTSTIQGSGLDIFNLKDWPMLKSTENMLVVAIVPRQGNPKIDVYAATQYEEDGSAKKSVYDNSVNTFCKDVLVPAVKTMYNVDWSKSAYVDLTISTAHPLKSPTDVYIIPKTTSRGDNKGKAMFVSREFIEVYPLVLFEEEKVEEVEEVVEEVVITPDTQEGEKQVDLLDSILETTSVDKKDTAANVDLNKL